MKSNKKKTTFKLNRITFYLILFAVAITNNAADFR
jgi:hypothetical protein